MIITGASSKNAPAKVAIVIALLKLKETSSIQSVDKAIKPVEIKRTPEIK